ncbi:hypothetical protein F5883DRAFT_149585 [Diaporthe sp. PMI_573]|nr:hypothetical protein F5883DRAFT_149585 [Diaporthaceae sp. PMI_573]
MWDHHFTLVSKLPSLKRLPRVAGRIAHTDKELERLYKVVALGLPGLPGLGNLTEALDAHAEALVSLIHNSAQATGRTTSGQGKHAPWWTEQYDVLHQDMVQKRRLRGS